MLEMVNAFVSSFFQIFTATTFGLMFLALLLDSRLESCQDSADPQRWPSCFHSLSR